MSAGVDSHLVDGVSNADGNGSSSRSRESSYVGVACEHCKKAKRKCDGASPCQACVARGLPCVIDESKDGRRGRKRTLDHLYSKADALDMLLNSLKSSENASLQELLTLIRNDASLEKIVAHAKTILRQDANQNLSRNRIHRAVLDIASLIDEPPIRVPAKPWTDVTDNDNVVSHLISVYFTWHHYGYPSVDQDLFVREMQSGNLSSQLCSSFLVNSMLAMACMYTDHRAAFATPGDLSTRGLHFLDEATRLWTLVQAKPCLANLQAFPPLISSFTALGKDRIGILYTTQSITVGTELVREVKKNQKRDVQEFKTAEFQKSYALAQWAAYMVQTEVAIAWAKPLDLQKPVRPQPYTERDMLITKAWRPYPKAGPDCLYFPFALDMARFGLYDTVADLRPLVLSGNPEDSPLPGYIILDHDSKLDRLQKVDTNLLEWHEKLPFGARIGNMDNSTPAGPLAELHIAYYGFRISTASIILRMPGLAEAPKRAATEIVLNCCRTIAQIFEWLQRTIGLTYFGVYHVHGASLSAYSLLEHLSEPGIPDLFHILIVALTGAYRWTLVRGIVRMIWIELQKQKLEHSINPSTLSILKLSAVDSWGPEDHLLFERCAYPNYAAIRERGNVFAEMGELLEEYSRLRMVDGEEVRVDEEEAMIDGEGAQVDSEGVEGESERLHV